MLFRRLSDRSKQEETLRFVQYVEDSGLRAYNGLVSQKLDVEDSGLGTYNGLVSQNLDVEDSGLGTYNGLVSQNLDVEDSGLGTYSGSGLSEPGPRQE
jgi:hypothetical protein